MANNKFLHTGNIIIAGFACCVIGMSALVYGCLKQDVQMVTKNYYEKELNFQNDINAKKNAYNYDEEFSLTNRNDSLIICIPKYLSSNITNGKINFYCVSDIKNDKTITINSSENGIYYISIADWQKANFVAKISFNSHQTSYLKELSFTL